ncbi:hypothetical protein M408DRAFT_290895 [Serendipita vermifera MAFF 305830]|uniref:Uncharacterized protein n=1 Tax=Serendipita vermifera MAFF 305830 TaxID=933852 RepID=A0A0C3ASW9_SERVB|nr:hypothetical protein M408DRAFT_290895 [Serendipita vermifera MAFF 305830]
MVIVCSNSSITIFSYTPPSVADIAGAMFNCAIKLGGGWTSNHITASIDEKAPPITPSVYELIHWLDEVIKDMWKAPFKDPCCRISVRPHGPRRVTCLRHRFVQDGRSGATGRAGEEGERGVPGLGNSRNCPGM